MRNPLWLVVVMLMVWCSTCTKKKLDQEKPDATVAETATSKAVENPYQSWIPQLVGKHAKGVTHVDWSPDGRRLLSTGRDALIILWQPESSRPIKVYKGHKKTVSMATFSPDGKHFVSTSFDETTRLWDVAKGKQRKVYKERISTRRMSDEELEALAARPDPQVNWATFSADGRILVTAADDFSLRFWDVFSAKLLSKTIDDGCRQRRVYAHKGGGASWITSSGCMEDGVAYLKFWDDKGDQKLVLGSENRDAHYIALDPRGRFLVTADGSTFLTIYSAQGSYLKQLMLGTYHFCLAFSPSGEFLAVGTDADGIYVYRVDGFVRLGKIQTGDKAAIDALDFNPTNSKLAVGTRKGHVWVFNDAL